MDNNKGRHSRYWSRPIQMIFEQRRRKLFRRHDRYGKTSCPTSIVRYFGVVENVDTRSASQRDGQLFYDPCITATNIHYIDDGNLPAALDLIHCGWVHYSYYYKSVLVMELFTVDVPRWFQKLYNQEASLAKAQKASILYARWKRVSVCASLTKMAVFG